MTDFDPQRKFASLKAGGAGTHERRTAYVAGPSIHQVEELFDILCGVPGDRDDFYRHARARQGHPGGDCAGRGSHFHPSQFDAKQYMSPALPLILSWSTLQPRVPCDEFHEALVGQQH